MNTTGTNAIAGNLAVNGGTAKLLQASQIASGKNLVVGGGTFDIQGNNQTVANVQLTGGSINGSDGTLTSANAYDKFAASLNRGVMARIKRLAAKGVRPAKNKPLPGNLARYEITKTDDTIQGEAEEVTNILSLPKDAA